MQSDTESPRFFTPRAQTPNQRGSLETEFWVWFDNHFSKYVVDDFSQVCLKVIHGIPKVSSLRPKGELESEMSAQNRLRNVPRAYKRDLRFKLIDLYVKPSKVPWTQTFALHMLKLVFNTTASATYVNKAFASSSRTSKERIDFRPVLNSITQEDLALLRTLYEKASDLVDQKLLPQAKAAADNKAGALKAKESSRSQNYLTSPGVTISSPANKNRRDFQSNQFSLF